MSHSIQIYSGEGASSICVRAWKRELKDIADGNRYKIEEFKPSYTAGFERGNIAMIIIPGGNAVSMVDPCEALAAKINQAVADQSAFLGSCAGALVSASFNEAFVPLSSQPICNTLIKKTLSSFNINPVPYSSKYYLPKSNSVLDPENRSAIDVEWLPSCGNFESRLCKLYHAFGPGFLLEMIPLGIRSNCRSLIKYKTEGTYRKSEHPSAAILFRPSGACSSPRLLTGVHPEIGISDICSQDFAQVFGKPGHPHINSLANMLEASEEVRKEICRSWFTELGISLQD